MREGASLCGWLLINIGPNGREQRDDLRQLRRHDGPLWPQRLAPWLCRRAVLPDRGCRVRLHQRNARPEIAATCTTIQSGGTAAPRFRRHRSRRRGSIVDVVPVMRQSSWKRTRRAWASGRPARCRRRRSRAPRFLAGARLATIQPFAAGRGGPWRHRRLTTPTRTRWACSCTTILASPEIRLQLALQRRARDRLFRAWLAVAALLRLVPGRGGERVSHSGPQQERFADLD